MIFATIRAPFSLFRSLFSRISMTRSLQ